MMHLPDYIHGTFTMTGLKIHQTQTIITVGIIILIDFGIANKKNKLPTILSLIDNTLSFITAHTDFIHGLPVK